MLPAGRQSVVYPASVEFNQHPPQKSRRDNAGCDTKWIDTQFPYPEGKEDCRTEFHHGIAFADAALAYRAFATEREVARYWYVLEPADLMSTRGAS